MRNNLIMVLCTSILLSACGGGGSGNNNQSSTNNTAGGGSSALSTPDLSLTNPTSKTILDLFASNSPQPQNCSGCQLKTPGAGTIHSNGINWYQSGSTTITDNNVTTKVAISNQLFSDAKRQNIAFYAGQLQLSNSQDSVEIDIDQILSGKKDYFNGQINYNDNTCFTGSANLDAFKNKTLVLEFPVKIEIKDCQYNVQSNGNVIVVGADGGQFTGNLVITDNNTGYSITVGLENQ